MANRDYNLGNLQLGFKINSDSSINKFINKLNNLEKALDDLGKIKVDDLSQNLERLSKLKFENLVNAFKPLEEINTKAVNAVEKTFKTLNNLEKSNFNFEAIKQNMVSLADSVQPFLDKIKEAEPSLQAFSNALNVTKLNAEIDLLKAKTDELNKRGLLNDQKLLTEQQRTEKELAQIKEINQRTEKKGILDDLKIQKGNIQLDKTKLSLQKVYYSADKVSTVFNKIFNLGKLYFLFNYFKRVGNFLGSIVSNAIDFEETLNKFQVSMGEYYDRAIEFAGGLARAFNLSTESILNYQSTFKNMLSSLTGLSSDVSYRLSETLTRMAIDYASLFNVTIDTAMSQFQSALSGQIRAIRSTSGFDVTQSTLEEVYKSIEGTTGKSVRSLSQLEKRLLIILAIQKQMVNTGSIGDFERTISSSSNMLKQMAETLKEIKTEIGQLLLKYLNPIFERTLAVFIVVRELLYSLKMATGYEPPRWIDENTTSDLEKAENSTNQILEDVEEVKRSLLGLDRLNILGSGTVTDTATQDVEAIEKAIGAYSTDFSKVKNNANDIAAKMLEWLGFSKDINGEFYQLKKTTDGTKTNFEKIVDTIKLLTSLLAGATIAKTISSIGATILQTKESAKHIKELLDAANISIAKVGKIAGIVALIITAILMLREASDNFREAFDSDIIKVFKTLGTILKSIFQLVSAIWDAVEPIFELIGNLIAPGLQLLGEFIDDMSFLIEEAIKPIISVIELLSTLVQLIFAGFSGDSNLIDQLTVKLVNIFFDLVEGILNFIINAAISLINLLTSALSKIWTWIPGLEDKAIPKIPYVDIDIPEIKLATGGVATKPTTALIGEYSNAKNNPEIVSPVGLMSDTFMDAVFPMVQAIVQGNNNVVNAINEKDMTVEINGRKFYESTFNDFESVAARKGKRI